MLILKEVDLRVEGIARESMADNAYSVLFSACLRYTQDGKENCVDVDDGKLRIFVPKEEAKNFLPGEVFKFEAVNGD